MPKCLFERFLGRLRGLVSVFGVLLLSACAAPASLTQTAPAQPEAPSGYVDQLGWTGIKFAVAAANPLATAAGYQILKAGGSAVDAAIAVQMVLSLVEPQSSGVGGGAFLLHFDGRRVQALDGRETAPAAAGEQLFIGPNGAQVAFQDAVVGGRSVGVPGALRMLEMAHQQHGRLPWAQLFQPAIALAEQGFNISLRLHMLLKADAHLKKDPVALAYFYQADGSTHAVGHTLRNLPLADLFRKMAQQGAQALHKGPVAQAIVAKVRQHPDNPGQLSLADLAGYRAIEREPLCHDYRALHRDYRICGMPPPSSGGVAIGQILGMLNHTAAAELPLLASGADSTGNGPSAHWLHLYTEAARLAFADRAQFLGDPDFVQPPGAGWASLLEPDYLRERASHIEQQADGKRMTRVKAGQPGPVSTTYAPMSDQPEFGTSHLSIVDGFGNALAMTTTIEDAFGARQMVNTLPDQPGGFLLNNQLTDFSFAPTDAQGVPVANRVQPGKRPRSSMSPTLVFDKSSGALVMSAGSPGGALIIHYTAKTLYGVLNWGLTPQQAVSLPNFGSLGGPVLLEAGRFDSSVGQALKSRNHEVLEIDMTSGLQAIVREDAQGRVKWLGGADPRREGVVLGD